MVFFKTNDANAILWALKPGEEGGTVGRLWNVENKGKTVAFSFDETVKSSQEITHVETAINKLESTDNKINLALIPNQMKSFQVFLIVNTIQSLNQFSSFFHLNISIQR